MDRSFGRDDVLLLLAVLAFLAGASIRFAQLASRDAGLAGAGKGTRLFFAAPSQNP